MVGANFQTVQALEGTLQLICICSYVSTERPLWTNESNGKCCQQSQQAWGQLAVKQVPAPIASKSNSSWS